MSTKSQSTTAEKPTIGKTLDALEKSLKDEASAEATARADQLSAMLKDYLRMLIEPPADASLLSDLARELGVGIDGIRADAEAVRLVMKHRSIFSDLAAAKAAVPVSRAARDEARKALVEAERAYVHADARVLRAGQAGYALLRIAQQRPGFFANPTEQNPEKLRLVIE